MKKIPVKLGINSYNILVGDGAFLRLPELLISLKVGRDAIIITNPLVKRLYGKYLAQPLEGNGFSVQFLIVTDSEKSKSAQVAVDLVGKIAAYAADKKPFIIALGGGVIGDLAGFVAAIYKRGIPFIQVPTTLLAQVDSSIGGKVAVDLPQGKNLMGAFYQPRLVLTDTNCLRSLQLRQLRDGLAEVVKYGVIDDTRLFVFLEKNYKALLAAEPKALAHIVTACAAIKARVVALDERDVKDVRVILNFGHTIGHAIETAAGYDKYNHGEAVALGMRAACFIACRLKLMDPIDMARVETLLNAIGLPEKLVGVSREKILRAIMFDKKFCGKKNRFVLCPVIGESLVRENIPSDVIKQAVEYLLSQE